MRAKFSFNHVNKTTPFSKISVNKYRVYRPLLLSMSAIFALSGCASKSIDKTPSNHIYHAPAQAYNLSLNNPAILGKPVLKAACSTKGNTLAIRDKANNYYKIDVINLLADNGLVVSPDKETFAINIAKFFAKKYQSDTKVNRLIFTKMNETQMYFPLFISAEPGSEKAIGFLVSRYDNFLFVVQHIQNHYNLAQMQQRLLTLQQNMQIPGSLTNLKKVRTENLGDNKVDKLIGFIAINPQEATPQQIEDWKKVAECY